MRKVEESGEGKAVVAGRAGSLKSRDGVIKLLAERHQIRAEQLIAL